MCVIGAVYRYEIYQDRIIFERYKKSADSCGDENKAIEELRVNPLASDIIPHSGGFRKLCVAVVSRGKRGGARFIYFYIVKDSTVYFVMAYKKNQKINLTSAELKVLAKLAKELGR